MKPRYTDAFWGKHPFDGDIILYKNKNKNKNNTKFVRPLFSTFLTFSAKLLFFQKKPKIDLKATAFSMQLDGY